MKLSNRLAIVAVIVAVLALAAIPLAAQENPPAAYPTNTITVAGSGTASGAPDIANLEIGVETRDSDLATAFGNANEQMDAVIAALVEAGVAREDIRTTGFNVYQDYYRAEPIAMEGGSNGPVFVVSNNVRVTVRDIGEVTEVVEAAVNAGATNIYGLNFGIDDTAELEREARSDAMANAEARAQQLAELIGAELGEVIIVNESGGNWSPFDVMNLSSPRMDGGGAGAPIEPGQLSVAVQLQVTYSISR